MAIVTETIRVVVAAGSANAQTFTKTVNVDTTTGNGTGPLSIPLTGVNAGTDTVQCFMDSHSLSSNQATIHWQATNGPIAVNVTQTDTYANNSKTRGWPGGFFSGSSDFGRTFPYMNAAPGANSLVLNQVFPNNPINGFNNQPTNVGPGGGYKLCPTVFVNQTATGTFASKVPITGTSDGAGGNADNGSDHPGFVVNIYGNLVVKTAGTYTFYGNYADKSGYAMWISGATVSSNNGQNAGDSRTNPFPANSPKFGYHPLGPVCSNNSAPLHPNLTSCYVTFPTAGIYPFEIVYNQWAMTQFSGDDNSYFQITYLSGTQNQNVGQGPAGVQSFPVALIGAPPTGATPTGVLRLTPVGGSANLQIQGQQENLTLTVQGVPYTSIPYCPILEGTAGSMFITNSGANFTFPTFNGNPVNTTLAASNAFSITANNSAIAGLFSVTSTGAAPAPFKFNYNGGAFAFANPSSQISSSSVTITADDIAWFDTSSGKFDLFNGGAGSTDFSIDVDYMTKPNVASVSPTSLPAGKTTALQINLDKPMSPMQQGLYGTGNTVNISGTLTAGATLGTFSPILNNGFLTGWTTTATVPPSSTNGTTTLNLNVNGTLTYLSGTSFVTTSVSYINGNVATITTTGGFVPPVGVSLTTSPSSTNLSSTSPTTVIGTEYTYDNPSSCTVQFFKKFINSGVRSNIGAPTSTPTNQITTTVGGKTVYQKTYQISFTFPAINGTSQAAGQINLGFDVTDNTSGLTTTYQSTTTYQEQVNIVGGGGGGAGCPTWDMWIDADHQAQDVYVGMELDCLVGEEKDFASQPLADERFGILKHAFGERPCWRFKTENGAEVVVSEKTPMPTRENLERGEESPWAMHTGTGVHVATDVGHGPEWSKIIEAEFVGERLVVHIDLGGRTFASGVVPNKRIYTHNIQAFT